MSSHYEPVPVDDKDESLQDERQVTVKDRTRKRVLASTFLLTILSVVLFYGVLINSNILSETSGNRDPTNEEVLQKIKSEWAKTHADDERATTGDQYLIGIGKADITGPVVQLNFIGYASLPQVGTGLRQRLYARTFIIGSVSNPEDRFVYLVLDTQSGDTAVRYGVVNGVAELGDDYSMYGQQNIALTGTHSHSGPGAWANYLLLQVTSLGFSQESYQALVDGAILSVKRAHESLEPGYISYGTTNITDANINRSLYAYLNNPADERAQYDTTVDTELTMLRFQRASDNLYTGVLTWFPVHGTSMLENNTHVTGDNKGVAAYLFEQAVANESTAAPGFVAGFSQANVGDTTPNVLGAWCDDGSGEMCTLENSTCMGKSENCHGRGPEFQALDLGVSSCYEIGRRQFAGAKALYDSFETLSTPVSDPSVKFFHKFNNMENYTFPLSNGTTVSTCAAALGYSFAAGTTDGPGAFDFTQNDPGSPDANPFWAVVSDLLRTPTPAQVACQQPKPILLDVGQMSVPYAWAPNIVDIQMLRVGQVFMIISASEATTMSGRRWKSAIAAAAKNTSITSAEPLVVLGGPANTYAHYVATEEEYAIQRYEGASTLYGQNELNAYIHLTTSNIAYLSSNATAQILSGPLPPDNQNVSLTFISPVVYDNPPLLKSFGDVTSAPNASYAIGDVVNATFVGANPRNNLRLEGTFAAVEQLLSNGSWTQIRDDSDWHLVYSWEQTDTVTGTSSVTISWETVDLELLGGEAGTMYRIVYNGDSKTPVTGTIVEFVGRTGEFTVG